ncbi:MAG: hypothetical protein NTV25_08720 [Methanothrix sp.]|nr:hypothetical protein [Methanothrix sp.]
MKKCICKNCGAVNEVSTEEDEDGEWLACTIPEGFEWTLPAGKITPVIGEPIYISAHGEQLSYQEYLEEYNVDPEIAYHLMRGRINARAASRIMSRQSKVKAQVSSKMRSQNWLDEDDWTA